MDPEDPTVPYPTPDDPEPYTGQTPPEGYEMQPRMLWLLRKALAQDVEEDSSLVEGQWLKSKRLVMCSQELEWEPTVPHACPTSSTGTSSARSFMGWRGPWPRAGHREW
jgi:hypothetical protein